MERLEPNVIALTYVDAPWLNDTFSRNMRARDANDIRQRQDRELKEWLIFLYKVFQQNRRILLDRGTVFVHSTTQQNNRIRLILDQTMGSENFRGEFIWPIRSGARSHNAQAPRHDTIILYSKTNDFTYNAPLKPRTADDLARFNHSDTRGRFMSVNLLSPVERPK